MERALLHGTTHKLQIAYGAALQESQAVNNEACAQIHAAYTPATCTPDYTQGVITMTATVPGNLTPVAAAPAVTPTITPAAPAAALPKEKEKK